MRKQMTLNSNADAIMSCFSHNKARDNIMKIYNLWLLALINFTLLLSGCNKDKGEKPESFVTTASVSHFLWSEKTEHQEARFEILNQYNEPLANAQILIGDEINSPFQNNLITTDKFGIAIVPANWNSPASVTVDAEGYIRQSLLNVKPGNLKLKLKVSSSAQGAEVRGLVNHLPVVNGDGFTDFALVMPALEKSDLLNLNMDQFISPYTDPITVANKKRSVTSNISLPKQKETYIISITLNKPVYRLKVPTLGTKKFAASRGRFVFKTVAAELNDGKELYELVNHFSFLGGGIRETSLIEDLTNLDIPANEIEFDKTLTLSPAATQADELLFVLAASHFSNSMITTDFKRATNKQVLKLQSIQNKPTTIVSLLKRQSEFMSQNPGSDRISASFLAYSPSRNLQKMLPLISNPSIVNTNHYTISLPSFPTTEGINPLAVSASISDLIEVKDGDKTLLVPIKKWDILELGWNQQLILPKWPLETSTSRQRVEVKYIGSSLSKNSRFDDSLITNATHMTHASADF